ncbi:MAG TPA: aminotransferase class V-fold PLP-dependent enzyme, partial [Thermoprotei archaeon]|nr:aminotransferase class V-fold PLP-dependent enzyme [Thermoprotei archaeon]
MEDYREYFPIINEKIFLNHAATSPLPLPVLDAMKNVLDKRRYGMIRIDTSALFNEARGKVAKLINCSSGEIAFLQNTSQALNIVANGLKVRNGDNIVTDNIEFPSVTYPWLNRNDVEVRFAENVDGTVPLDMLVRKIDLNTRVIAISHVIYSSGYRFDLKKLRK